MGAPYSQDLRQRVLSAIDSGMSKMTAHQTFGVSRSTIDDWLQLREQTGALSAKTTYRRGPAPTMADQQAFRTFAQRHSGCTLRQMAQAWQEETGQQLSLMPFLRALRRIGSTRQKRVGATRNVMSSSVPRS